MKQIALLLSAVISAATLVAAEEKASGGKVREADQRPNVLMICIDDLNDWTGFLGGHPDVQTPHMDKLAKSGRNFTNAHCTVPVCSCSRISVMSGLAATTHGSYEIGPPYQGIPLLKDYPTIHRYSQKTTATPLYQEERCCITGSAVACRVISTRWSAKALGPNPRTRPKVPISRPAEWSKYWDPGVPIRKQTTQPPTTSSPSARPRC